jgi:putative (di)nucleoside polyphosphate hydrolase
VYRLNVSNIVFKGDGSKFLLVHKPRERHAWQFPQGGIDEGEAIREAGHRELKEELGTDKFVILDSSSHVFFYKFPDGETRDGFQGQKQNYLWVKFTGEEEDIQLNLQELDNYRWVYEEELGKYLESKPYLDRVKKVISEMKSLHFEA